VARTDIDTALSEIIKEYEAGTSFYALAEKYKTTRHTLRVRFKKAGVLIRSGRPRRRDLDEAILSIVEEYSSGAELSFLAKKHRTTTEAIRRRLLGAGVEIRSNCRRKQRYSNRPDLDAALPDIIDEYESGSSAASLAKEYQANIWSILKRLRDAGVSIRSNKEQNEKRLNLTPGQNEKFVSIVDGLLLGDGSISRRGILRLEQSKKRLGWLEHVAFSLSSIGSESKLTPLPPQEVTIEDRMVRYKGGGLVYTPCYVECQEQRKRWYPEGTKIVPEDVVLTPLSLAYWFCGDGSYGNNGQLMFYTNSFRKENVGRLANGLTKLGVEARCVPAHRPNEYKVSITKIEAACRFKEIVLPHMPECCMYKLRYVRPPSKNRSGTLTFDQAEEIRRRYTAGETQSQIAREYGVTSQTVGSIVRGKTHKRRVS
jgi:Mor family transcriptional regulator